MQHRNSRKGFTLIELLITIGLTTLLSTLVIAYSNASRQQTTLYIEGSKIAQTILRAKTLAISTYNQSVVPCGYGVEIDYSANEYALFSYDDGTPSCSTIQSPGAVIGAAQKTELNRFSLQRGFIFDQAPLDSLTNVLFLPPAPRTLISLDAQGNVGASPGRIYITAPGSSSRVPVTVNVNGQVTF